MARFPVGLLCVVSRTRVGAQRYEMWRQALATTRFGSQIGAVAAKLSNVRCGCACAYDVAMEEVGSLQA